MKGRANQDPADAGGGAREQTRIQLTADLCARAIIAAAREYHDDPVAACVSTNRGGRRALSAAASAIARVTGETPGRISLLFGFSRSMVSVARHEKRGPFRRAEAAAERAARYAGWRPEARASVLAGVAADDVAATPASAPEPERELRRFAARAKAESREAIRSTRRSLPPAPAAVDGPAPDGRMTPADARHIRHIHAANGGRGYPAPAVR